ncbi:M15 family metallopeptidase [Cellulosimicrobium protaetiae]|uniref:M15 family metallopeptidase n=1 Tax=Cellulosimicrobium protaetiae TaxID=2587808 RepID=A0A6M5UCI2_9MICO|nr:M15 family metallopeptidase [Cellulosimicrobium protaetiae]QJW35051.1 M15 family metallopeptidase [Cellulosimicrobium protaetiae]
MASTSGSSTARTVVALGLLLSASLLVACSSGLDPSPTPAGSSSATPAPGPSDRSTPPEPTASAPAAAADQGGPAAQDVPASAPPAVPQAPVFESTVSEIDAGLAARMTPSSWREGCPVPLSDLRYLTLSHRTFEGGVATGELVVHADVADGVVTVFRTLFDAGYPIRSMRLVDDFGGDDDASMAADNTSAFNCRPVAGTDRWSEHSFGRAIDVNPVENPWVRGTAVAPPAGAAFVAREPAPGVVLPDDVVVRAFAAAGWSWGGAWESPVDYQHFSTTGR